MERKTKLSSKRVIAIIGFVVGGFWIIGVLVCLSSRSADAMIYLVLALACILPSIWRMLNVNRWEKILFLIGAKNEVSMDSLMQATNSTYERLVKELPKVMRKSGLNGYVDIDRRMFVIYSPENNMNISNNIRPTMRNNGTTYCPSCGATNSQEACKKGKCEYCGSPLSSK